MPDKGTSTTLDAEAAVHNKETPGSATFRKDDREPVTLLSIPQELIDNIVERLLPTTLQVMVHKFYAQNEDGTFVQKKEGTNDYEVACRVERVESFKWTAELSRTARKVRKAVDEKLKPAGILELNIINHPTRGRPSMYDIKAGTMSSETFATIVEKYNINTVTTQARFAAPNSLVRGFSGLQSYSFGSEAHITPVLKDGERTLQKVQWSPSKPKKDYARSEERYFRRVMEGVVMWKMEIWTRDEFTAASLARLQECLLTPPEKLQHESLVAEEFEGIKYSVWKWANMGTKRHEILQVVKGWLE